MGIDVVAFGNAGIDLECERIDRAGFSDVHHIGLESGGLAGLHRRGDGDRDADALKPGGNYGIKRRV